MVSVSFLTKWLVLIECRRRCAMYYIIVLKGVCYSSQGCAIATWCFRRVACIWHRHHAGLVFGICGLCQVRDQKPRPSQSIDSAISRIARPTFSREHRNNEARYNRFWTSIGGNFAGDPSFHKGTTRNDGSSSEHPYEWE